MKKGKYKRKINFKKNFEHELIFEKSKNSNNLGSSWK